MTEQEPDLSPVSDKLVGTPSAALPRPNKGEPDLFVAESPEVAARRAAERIAASLIAAVECRGRADFCTTGGNTPIPIYRLLASTPLCDSIPWPQVHFWWGDDRFVPRGVPESCVTSFDQVLLGGHRGVSRILDQPVDQTHPALDLRDEAERQQDLGTVLVVPREL